MKNVFILFCLMVSANLYADASYDVDDPTEGNRLIPKAPTTAPAPAPITTTTTIITTTNGPAPAPAAAGNNSSKQDSSGEKCSKLDDAEASARPLSNQGNDVQYPGTPIFQRCDKLSRGNIKTIYHQNGGRNSNFSWEPYVRYSCLKKGFCDDGDEKKKTKYENCVKEENKLAVSCESVLHAISFFDRDWNDSDYITANTSKSQAAQPQQQQQGGAANAAAAAASINCQSMGIETVDYVPCRKFQVQLGLIEGVQGVAYGTQEIVYKEKISDAQAKYVAEDNTATGALKATRDSLKMQQDMYQQRTALDATKLAYLVSIYNEIPKSDEVIAKCDRLVGKNLSSYGIQAPIEKEACVSAVRAGTGGFAINMNGPQMDAMKAKLVAIAAQAGSSLLLSSLLGKRADDVNKAIAKIDSFKPLDPYVASEEDAATTFCKQNPGLPQCLTGGLDRTFDQSSENIITFGDSGPATTYSGNKASDTANGLSEDGIMAGDTTTKPMGAIIPAAAHDNSIEASNAAKVSSGGPAPRGGGGGGFGGGGGGGGGGLPQAPAQGGVTAAVQGKTPTYGGGAGSIAMMGGFGINKPKGDAKGEENPFGKLFGKDKGANTLNFRDPASKVGGKDDNLFDMISNRYNRVSADKRLIEYELTK